MPVSSLWLACGGRLLGGALLLLVSACSVLPPVPPVPRVAPTTVGPERVARLMDVALAHWQRWGAREAQLLDGQPLCLLQPDGLCDTVDDGCGDERSAGLCPLVDAYWQAVPPHTPRHDCERTDVCVTRWPVDETEPAPWTPAWSAAFVSAVLREAGFSETEFHASDGHARYVVAARDGWASAFDVVATPAVAVPGDLVCAVRGRIDLGSEPVPALDGGHPATPMHCDIVVAVDVAARRLQAVGGNVQQTVARTTLELDAAGRVSAALNPFGRWVLVMRLRRAP
ncbi:hypothetical protein BurJ1DRAFT_0028 [Burkholderiales bacterium JOSHI_001]|nr:hypothetical protein BurJ1DRAFT_0028 [Burkholderiales bacterium JOSHI_001]